MSGFVESGKLGVGLIFRVIFLLGRRDLRKEGSRAKSSLAGSGLRLDLRNLNVEDLDPFSSTARGM